MKSSSWNREVNLWIHPPLSARLLVCVAIAATVLVGCIPKSDEPVIWFIQNHREIRTIDPQTHQQQVVIPEQPGVGILNPALSPNRKKIAYVRGTEQSAAIWLSDSDGSNAIRITREYTGNAVGFVWLSDTQMIVMGTDQKHQAGEEGKVGEYDLVTRQTQPLIVPDSLSGCPWGWPSTHPGAITIHDQTVALGHLEVHGNQLVQVQDYLIDTSQISDWFVNCLAWTPDATKLVFVGDKDDQMPMEDIFLVTGEGASVRRLTLISEDYGYYHLVASISPNGKWVAFEADLRDSHNPSHAPINYLGLVSTDGGEFQITKAAWLAGNLVWSPDGRYIATGLSPLDSDPQNSLPKQLYLVDSVTKEVKQLISDGNQQEVFDWR